MTQHVTNVAVLGSTGSIGRSTIEVVECTGGRFRVCALTAHSSLTQLCQAAAQTGAKDLVVTSYGDEDVSVLLGHGDGN